jgi:crotonobetainyl-CoA:carnitine CoA-transferase CaiB-like acyl-CoA transferase
MSITGEPDEQQGGPVKVGVAVTDIFTGLYAANAIQGALLERHQSGLGQHIDLALLDVQAAVLANQASNYLIGGQVPERLGNAHPNIVPYQAFATADGHIILAVGNDSQFERLSQVLQQPQWALDPSYQTNAARVKNRQQLCASISQQLSAGNSSDWLRLFTEHQIPCGPINRIDEVFEDPQILARDMLVKVADKRAGEIKLVGNPINYSRSQIDYAVPPPELGDDTASVLGETLEFSQAELDALRKKSII